MTTSTLSHTMRAAAIYEFGGLDKIRIVNISVPTLGTDEVLVRVHAVSVTRGDVKQREGKLSGAGRASFPMILGSACAGTITSIGAHVTSLAVGDEVYAFFRANRGAEAEYVAINAAAVARKPARLSFVEAAAAIDAMTAHQAVVDALRVKMGETLLVAGGAGGVGAMAVQIGRACGANVIATARMEDLDYVRALGAAKVVDYVSADLRAELAEFAPGGVDAAVDCAGPGAKKRTLPFVCNGGRLAELVFDDIPDERGVAIMHIKSQPSAKRLEILCKMFEDGELIANVGATFPLERVADAQALVQDKHRGKVVLTVL